MGKSSLHLKLILLLLFHLFILITIIPVGQFTDSADYLLGGCLINSGKIIYRDFFSHHFPGMYYFAALLYKLSGSCSLLLPRILLYLFFIFTTTLFFYLSQRFLLTLIIVILYAFLGLSNLTFFPSPQSFLINISLIMYCLLFFQKKLSTFWYFYLFFLIQSSILILYPIYLPITVLMYVDATFSGKRTVWLASLTFLPAFIFWLFIDWPHFWQDVIIFNTKYYSNQYNLFNQYYFYFITQITNVLGYFHLLPITLSRVIRISLLFELTVFIFSFVALYFAWKKKKIAIRKIFLLMLVCVSLSVQLGGFHMLPLTFFLIAFVLYILETEKIFFGLFLSLIFVFSLRLFLGPYIFWLKNKNQDHSISKMVNIVNSQTASNDKILIYPLQPEVYLLTKREPGSYYYFFLPWVANNPDSSKQIVRDIAKNMPKLIIFNEGQNISGYKKVEDYSRIIITYLYNNPKYQLEKKYDLLIFLRR